ncbi:MAG: FAD-binding oxidoreductase [Candidatus Omnitrophota bacterium]
MLLKKDKDIIASYLEDYSNLKGGFAESVAIPEAEAEIIELLKQCSQSKTPVTISGAGTGVAGGRIPFGGVALSMEKFNKVISIGKTATVQAGVLLQDFMDEVERKGFFYPPDPTEKDSFLGANVSTGASGARTFKFGTTRDYVKRLRIVLSSGEIVDIERGKVYAGKNNILKIPTASGRFVEIELPSYKMPDTKNAAGYYVKPGMDAVDLFIGQDGTLGVITEVSLNLLDKPELILDCYAFFKKDDDCLEFIYEAKKGMDALSLEYFDENALNLLRPKHPEIPKGIKAACFFEQIAAKENEDELTASWACLMQKHNADLDSSWFVQTKKDRDKLHNFRHDVPDSVNEIIKKTDRIKVGTDIAVPDDKLAEMLTFYKKELAKSGIDYLIFGHIGNSHLHVNMLPKDKSEYERAKQIYLEFVKKAISLKGTVSAEHGIGKVKHGYLKLMYGEEAIAQMVKVKKALDPACILGLDNIFPKELLLQN